jgi:ketosteroid isomerase-like protein
VSDHPNVARVRELLSAFERRDLAAILAAIREDAVWRFPGRRGALAGAHQGREAILRFLARVPELTGRSFRMELLDVLANDRHAVVLFRGRAEREGRRLDNPTCLRIHLDEAGRAAEIWEFVWNLEHVEAFWS